MALSSGQSLSHYEIVELLGRGGMGDVYRARDAKLGRDVAIKVLAEDVANDPERMARFEREAKLLAQLNHPGIATLHGLESFDGTRCVVMELVEGETLAERLARGPIPWEEATPQRLFTEEEAGVLLVDRSQVPITVRYDVAPDGDRFLMVREVGDAGGLVVVQNFPRALEPSGR